MSPMRKLVSAQCAVHERLPVCAACFAVTKVILRLILPQKVAKMDVNKLNDLANRIMKGGRGAGAGVGLLAAIGGAAYGLYQSMYTGMQ